MRHDIEELDSEGFSPSINPSEINTKTNSTDTFALEKLLFESIEKLEPQNQVKQEGLLKGMLQRNGQAVVIPFVKELFEMHKGSAVLGYRVLLDELGEKERLKVASEFLDVLFQSLRADWENKVGKEWQVKKINIWTGSMGGLSGGGGVMIAILSMLAILLIGFFATANILPGVGMILFLVLGGIGALGLIFGSLVVIGLVIYNLIKNKPLKSEIAKLTETLEIQKGYILETLTHQLTYALQAGKYQEAYDLLSRIDFTILIQIGNGKEDVKPLFVSLLTGLYAGKLVKAILVRATFDQLERWDISLDQTTKHALLASAFLHQERNWLLIEILLEKWKSDLDLSSVRKEIQKETLEIFESCPILSGIKKEMISRESEVTEQTSFLSGEEKRSTTVNISDLCCLSLLKYKKPTEPPRNVNNIVMEL